MMQAAIDFTLKFGITLISILNPLGAIPTFLILTRSMEKPELRTLSLYCSAAVMTTILMSLLLGEKILGFFGISIPSFTIGGGILLASTALSMISANTPKSKLNPGEIQEKISAKEIGVVPLAIPLLSGPGTISTCIIAGPEIHGTAYWGGVFLMVAMVGLMVKLVFTYARPIGEKMGTVGLNIMTRIMGIILLSSAIEMMVKGLTGVLPQFRQALGL